MNSNRVIGTSVARRDLPQKLTGEAKYTSDIQLPGMLIGKVVRSPYPHARIVGIDTSAAENLPGVHAVLTPFDVPQGRLAPDLPILDTVVRYVGDEVAAVAADDEDLAEYAASLMKISYEPLPFVTTPREAMEPDAARVHPEGNLVGGEPLALTRGNVDEGFEQADRIFSMSYTYASTFTSAVGAEGGSGDVGGREADDLEDYAGSACGQDESRVGAGG